MEEEKGMEITNESQVDKAFLITAGDSAEADLLESRLNVNAIPVLRKYRGSGAFLNVALGKTSFGIDLYVPSDRLEEAQELITSGEGIEDEEILSDPSFSDESLAKANEDFLEKLDRRAKWMGIAFLAAIIILIYFIVRS